MYKLLIVDDEYYIREGMKKKIDWESYGVTVCGLAKNGIEAIEMVNEYEPDIVLTDICMNGIDGLSMIEQLNRQNFKGKFIIMSGHTLFEYAHKAIEEGVCFYLIKPVNKDKLIETVKKITSILDESGSGNIAKQLHKDEEIYEKLMTNTCENPPIFSNNIACKGYFQKPVLYDIDKKREILSAIKTLEPDALVFFNDNYTFSMIIGKLQNLNHIHNEILKVVSSNLWIGVSNKFSDYAAFSDAINESETAVMYRIYTKNTAIIYYDDYKKCRLNKTKYLSYADNIAEYTETNRCSDVKIKLTKLTEGFIENKVYPKDVLWFFNSIIFAIEKMCDKNAVENFMDFNSIKESMVHINTIIELRDTTYKLCADMISMVQKEKSNSAVDVEQIIEYMDKHCLDGITLTDISKYFYLDITYLSKIIKNATGQSFVKYVTGKRLLKAQELLKNTDMSISDIANRVGYCEANYFSQLFKKLVGVSATEYRENQVLD